MMCLFNKCPTRYHLSILPNLENIGFEPEKVMHIVTLRVECIEETTTMMTMKTYLNYSWVKPF